MAVAKSRSARVFEQIDLLLEAEFDGKQAAMAAALDVDEATIWRWSARRSHPQARHEEAIAERLERRLRIAARRQVLQLERWEDDEC